MNYLFLGVGVGIVALVLLLVWCWKRKNATANTPKPQTTTTTATSGGSAIEVSSPAILSNDVGMDHQSAAINLPSYIPIYSSQRDRGNKETGIGSGTFEEGLIFNTDDHNIDLRVQKQWALAEMNRQINRGQPSIDGLPQTGEFWLHTATTSGPLDPFTPRTPGSGKVIPGPQDPQLAYGMTIAASLDGQEQKFTVQEDPNDVTYAYRSSQQQLPGSHFAVDAASFDGFETPQVVDRFAHLPRVAAAWVIDQLNQKMRKEHPCFSLAGREHFELSNPPMQCGDSSNVKHDPISLIRIFECRVKKNRADNTQTIYLTLELGNSISAGSGGMFFTMVTMDKFQNFVNYTPIARDQKQTFVLPRTL